MRTCPFREVLHTVAEKVGMDPSQGNFQTDEAIPIGKWINQWVRRQYDGVDYPEWTVTHQFVPNNVNHIVLWDAYAIDLTAQARPAGTLVKLGRIIAVYLVNPATTNAPIETDYTLTPNGVHVGYDHGSSVWIKYIAPAPRFTAEVWSSSRTYKQDEAAYSSTTGEVYRSKSNSNRGHDPATSFSLPLDPEVESPAIPPPTLEMTQDWVPDNPGIALLPQILVVSFATVSPPPPPSDTPANGEFFTVIIQDLEGNVLGEGADTADGSTPLTTIITNVATALGTDLGGNFTVTPDTANKLITVEGTNYAGAFTANNSNFRTVEPISHFLKVVATQTYTPALAAATGLPRITRITITDSTTYPGFIYALEMIGTDGELHRVEYTSQIYDSSAQILQGLVSAVAASDDTFWETVQLAFDPDGLTLDVSIFDNASTDVHVDAPPPPAGGAWWELTPFPLALADQVIRGATADVLKEWGQTQEGMAEEQVVSQEAGIRTNAVSPSNAPLTEQLTTSRYRL